MESAHTLAGTRHAGAYKAIQTHAFETFLLNQTLCIEATVSLTPTALCR